MELQKIIKELHSYNPQMISTVGQATYIQTHKMIKPGQSRFFPGCLYVGYVSDLPVDFHSETVSSLVCINNTPLPDRYHHYKNLNMILVDYGTSQYDLLNQIADIMIDEAKLTSDMKLLLDALYSDLGLQHMVDVACEAFGNPIFVNDTAYKILAMSQSTIFDDPTLEEEKTLGYIHESKVSALKRDKLFERVRNSNYPLYSNETSIGWLFKSVKIHNIEVGEVAVMEKNRPFRHIDYELLDRFSKLIALEMEKNDFYKDNKGVMYNYLLADVLSGNLHNISAVTQRLSYLNWKVYRFFKVMTVIDHEPGLIAGKAQSIGQQLRQILPDCHWTVFQGRLVAFLSRPQEEIFTANEKQLLEEFLCNNHLCAGVSNYFCDILDAKKYYRQAQKAGELGSYLYKRQGLHFYADYLIAYIAELLAKRHNLLDFLHPALSVVQQYDLENNTQLLETLDRYLRYAGDPLAAAKSLNIHRNTLVYRINKIKELGKIDLSHGDERLHLQLSLKFLEFMKRLT